MKLLKKTFESNKKQFRTIAVVTMTGLALAVMIKPVLAENTNAVVSGIVFVDKNGNGKQDTNEIGLKGISVSDGRTIVHTDDNGKYTFTVDTERRLTDIVFVTTPSGYSVTSNEYKVPQFYQTLGNLQPGEQREQNFALLKTPESAKENFTFAGVADVHVQAGSTNNRERFTGQLAEINRLTAEPSFIVVSGDLTNQATDAEYADYMASTATSKVPVYPAVGNHDFKSGANYAERIDRYRSYLGPEWYSYDYGNKHFITLENTNGMSEPDQLEWLKADLEQNAKRKEVVVIVHKPLNTPQTPTPADNTKQYIDLLSQYNTRMVLMGHTHVNDVDTDTIPTAKHVTTNSSAYTIDQTPNGFRVINFKGNNVENPFKMYGVEESLTIVNPAPGSEVPQGSVQLQINAYNTSSSVISAQYRIDGGAWKKLSQSNEMTWTDKWDSRKTKLGQHTVEVRVNDDGNKTWSKSSTFNVVKASQAVVPQGGANWPMFHGNAQHTGKALDELSPNLKLAWSHLTPGTILTSSPAIVDGSVYVGTRDENGSKNNSVIAVDLKTGKEKWIFKTNAQVQASPAVVDGIVYASSIRGSLYAIDSRTGKQLWVKTVGKGEVQQAWMYYSPTVADGTVYQAYSTGNGGQLMALNARTGEVLWTSKLAGGWITESSPVVEAGKVYVGADGGYIIALDAKTGLELWRKKPAGGWMHSMPAVADGMVYMGYGGGLLVALDAQTGDEKWRYTSENSDSATYIAGKTTGSSPAVTDGIVYMGFPDGYVAALDAKTGTKVWSTLTKGGIISSAAVTGNSVYIGSNDGFLHAFDKTTGLTQWSYEIGAWVASSPAISGNTLVIGAFDGNLYGFTETNK
ncbi:PQQ-binding-like beta-propeller repeat protein [Paenibacillus solisilvae]|uniref:PQQ-binding-like beta-propeller repeat protein n=1 Tax=Paenibacillus solisilvae TaxID=2486751 RepID=A0ABW0W6Y8_9BACL